MFQTLDPVPWRTLRALAWATLLLLPALSVPPAQAQTQPQGQVQPAPGPDAGEEPTAEPPQRFDDWTLRCVLPPEQPDQKVCYLVQNISNKDTGQRLLQLAIGRFAVEQKLGLLITLPLGIRLPPGIVMTVDGKNPVKLQAERCLPNGCQFQFLIDEALIQRFKAGVKGEIAVQNLSNREVVVPFSLKGFTAGFAALPEAS